jgi:membrane associated rhomboid family serine protease
MGALADPACSVFAGTSAANFGLCALYWGDVAFSQDVKRKPAMLLLAMLVTFLQLGTSFAIGRSAVTHLGAVLMGLVATDNARPPAACA